MSGHTDLELPWTAINNGVDIVDVASCGLIANVWARSENRGGPKAQVKAAFIVTACNSHAELVKALEAANVEITKSARIICQKYDRKTRRYVFSDDLWKAKLPGSFSTIVQIRAALATLTARKA